MNQEHARERAQYLDAVYKLSDLNFIRHAADITKKFAWVPAANHKTGKMIWLKSYYAVTVEEFLCPCVVRNYLPTDYLMLCLLK